jgi:hypothetical protein
MNGLTAISLVAMILVPAIAQAQDDADDQRAHEGGLCG